MAHFKGIKRADNHARWQLISTEVKTTNVARLWGVYLNKSMNHTWPSTSKFSINCITYTHTHNCHENQNERKTKTQQHWEQRRERGAETKSRDRINSPSIFIWLCINSYYGWQSNHRKAAYRWKALSWICLWWNERFVNTNATRIIHFLVYMMHYHVKWTASHQQLLHRIEDTLKLLYA